MPTLNKAHIQRLYQTVNSVRDRALLTLLLDTGLQLNDISELKVSDYDPQEGKILLHDDIGRELHLQDDTVNSIDKWLEERPKTRDRHLFVTEKGDHKKLSTRGVDYILRQLGKQAGLPFALNVTVIKDMVDSKNGGYLPEDLSQSKDDSHMIQIIVAVVAAVFVLPLLIHFLIKCINENFSE